MLVCGDITHFGLPEELCVFLEEASPVLNRIPVLCVLGNHDFESGKDKELCNLLREAGVILLDGNNWEVHGVGFTGVKGFGGGFENRSLQPWGEPAIKNFVNEVVVESNKLESGLSKMDPGPRIVVLHYAPIRETVVGEPLEIFPFLGSSRLEEPLNRYAVTAVFHGHAHKGTFHGNTSTNIPVYNVATSVLKAHFPDRPPFFLFEVPTR